MILIFSYVSIFLMLKIDPMSDCPSLHTYFTFLTRLSSFISPVYSGSYSARESRTPPLIPKDFLRRIFNSQLIFPP